MNSESNLGDKFNVDKASVNAMDKIEPRFIALDT